MTINLQVGKTYKDHLGEEYLCTAEVKPCCSFPYFLMQALDRTGVYPYTPRGQRLDHKLKYSLENEFNIKGES